MKGWNKLVLQVIGLSILLMSSSVITETQLWLDYFNTKVDGSAVIRSNYVGDILRGCKRNNCQGNLTIHYHWNYRAIVYITTGIVLFIISVIRIGTSHKEEDF